VSTCGEGTLGRRLAELEQPLEVLSGQAGARAHQVLDQHLARGLGIAELELRQELVTGVCHVSFFWSTSLPSSKVVIRRRGRRAGSTPAR